MFLVLGIIGFMALLKSINLVGGDWRQVKVL